MVDYITRKKERQKKDQANLTFFIMLTFKDVDVLYHKLTEQIRKLFYPSLGQ